MPQNAHIVLIFGYSLSATASNMKEMREKLKTDELKQEWLDSVETPQDLLRDQMRRLSLKDRPFNPFLPAEDAKIEELWEVCLQLEDQLQVYKILY